LIDLLHERGIDISYETVQVWWNTFVKLSNGQGDRSKSSLEIYEMLSFIQTRRGLQKFRLMRKAIPATMKL